MTFRKTLMLAPVVALTLTATGGAWQSQPPQASPGEKAPAAGAAKKQEKTGIAECDKYFSMVDACLATNKMSADEKKAAQANVDRLRLMVPIAKSPEGRATLVDRCTKSIELGQKDDKYGCFTPAPKSGESR